jgi:hypothetical protein
MRAAVKARPRPQIKFGKSLRVEQLIGLKEELQKLRHHPPLVQRSDGKYEGDILGFVRGLRLSARVIYFLRERLSDTDLQINWGHLLDPNEDSCSRECDVVIHVRGHVRKWNGTDKPIMEFTFIEAAHARAVVSCKSTLKSIDKDYPKDLKKYGVKNIFLFAECCAEADYPRLRKAAKKAGYRGLWCLYLTRGSAFFETDESMYVAFGDAVMKAVHK